MFNVFTTQEAVKRTKITLKLLEAKRAAAGAAAVNESAHSIHRIGSQNVSPSNKRRSTIGVENKLKVAKRGGTAEAAVLASVPAAPAVTVATPKEPRALGKSKGNAANESRSRDGKPTTLLQRLTEEYSDRVGERGGGTPSCSGRNLPVKTNGAGVGGGGGKGPMAERKRAHAAALTVQHAFRLRMFHRFIWAQAYLRRPLHAFRLFARVSRPLVGTSFPSPVTVKTGAVGALSGDTGIGGAAAGGATARMILGTACISDGAISAADSESITSLDAWLELPGFCVYDPRHVHSVDDAFWNYSRWHRKLYSCATSAAGATAVDRAFTTDYLPTLGTETSLNMCAEGVGGGGGEEDKRGTTTEVASSTSLLAAGRAETATTMPPAPGQAVAVEPPSSPPEGAHLFERKHAVRKEAVRVLLLDLRLPLTLGALDMAIEDLGRVISKDYSMSLERDQSVDLGGPRVVGLEVRGAGTGAQRTSVGQKKIGAFGQGQGISFVSFYDWWMRHLPYDPASASCLMKTVRCARGLHAAEVSSGRF